MTRNFGRPRCIGATTPGAPSSRAAVSREPIWLAGLEADLIGEMAPGSPRVAATRLFTRSHPLGARNEDASIQLAGSSRPANSRGESPELSTASARYRALERGAMCLVFLIGAFMAAFIGAAMVVISLVIRGGLFDS